VIPAYAFEDCTKLKTVVFPASLSSVNFNSFRGCRALESISLSGECAEYEIKNNCLIQKSTKTLVLGTSNSVIPDDGSVEIIAYSAFAGLTGLREITIPSPIKEIGQEAFEGCGIQTLVFEEGVQKIGFHAFSECKNLTEVRLPESVTEYGIGAFKKCTSIKTVYVSKNTANGSSLFEDSTSLETVYFAEDIEKIPEYMFEGCTSIKSIAIPGSLTELGYHAFNNCEILSEIKFGGTKAEWEALTAAFPDWGKSYYTVYCSDGNITK
jgi:hypothetical protein